MFPHGKKINKLGGKRRRRARNCSPSNVVAATVAVREAITPISSVMQPAARLSVTWRASQPSRERKETREFAKRKPQSLGVYLFEAARSVRIGDEQHSARSDPALLTQVRLRKVRLPASWSTEAVVVRIASRRRL